ncbi:Hydroxyacylglutathione hydrolase [subsurface metagenome]
MSDINQHFKIVKHKDYLYVIQENISIVHSAYTNDPLNMYLILGNHSALLIDTGCGISPLKPIVDKLIGSRKLLVFNSHAHWDHVLGNEEFGEVYIHENEEKIVSEPYNLSDTKELFAKYYANRNFSIPPAKIIKKLRNGDVFDLGNITIKVIHAPGHSSGSICLLTNKNELFTGDVAYYGDQFLPRKRHIPIVLESLSKLIELCEKNKSIELYPSHRQFPCDINLLTELYKGVSNIKNLWHTRNPFELFYAWEIKDEENDRFRYYVSRL